MAQETQQEERRLTELPPVTSGGKVQMGLFVLELLDLLDAGQSQFPDDQGNYKQRVKLKWQVYEVIDCDVSDPDDLIGQLWFQFCNYTMAQKSTLLGIATAILQREIPDGTAPRPLELIGGKVKMTIAERMGRGGKIETTWTPQAYRVPNTQQPRPAPTPGLEGSASNPNASRPREAAPGNQEPTPRQFKFLSATARELGLTDDDVAAQSMLMFGKPTEQLARAEVSALIEWIQAEDTAEMTS